MSPKDATKEALIATLRAQFEREATLIAEGGISSAEVERELALVADVIMSGLSAAGYVLVPKESRLKRALKAVARRLVSGTR
jgi:hypothetical protein